MYVCARMCSELIPPSPKRPDQASISALPAKTSPRIPRNGAGPLVGVRWTVGPTCGFNGHAVKNNNSTSKTEQKKARHGG